MKKTLITFIFCLLYLLTSAQTEKGTLQLGIGGLPVFYPNNSLPTGYSLRANVGYFISNRFAVGIMPFAGKVEEINSIGASVYSRLYLIDKKYAIFLEAGAGFGSVKYDNSSWINGTMSTVNIGPGMHYTFKNKLSVELLLQYARLKNISYPENTLTGNTFIPTLGIQYFIFK